MKLSRIIMTSIVGAVVLPLVVLGLCFLPYALAIFLIGPARDFTPTSPLSYLLLSLIAATLLGLIVKDRLIPHSPVWERFAHNAARVLAFTTPLAPLAVLYLLSWRGMLLLGHWPQYLTDDPKGIGSHDCIYRSLFATFDYAAAFTSWGLWTFGALLLHLRQSLTRRQIVLLVGMFLLAWGIFLIEPGGRFSWWLD